MFKLPINTKNGGNNGNTKYHHLCFNNIKNQWRLEGLHINIVAVIFEYSMFFVFFNLGAGKVNVAGSFLH